MKRFNRIPNTDLFEDGLTGEEIRFTNAQRILRLLNSLNAIFKENTCNYCIVLV